MVCAASASAVLGVNPDEPDATTAARGVHVRSVSLALRPNCERARGEQAGVLKCEQRRRTTTAARTIVPRDRLRAVLAARPAVHARIAGPAGHTGDDRPDDMPRRLDLDGQAALQRHRAREAREHAPPTATTGRPATTSTTTSYRSSWVAPPMTRGICGPSREPRRIQKTASRTISTVKSATGVCRWRMRSARL